jgi:hypothetical protein
MKMSTLHHSHNMPSERQDSRETDFSRHREAGFALVWWALFIGLAAFPLLVFVVEGARYMQAAGAVQKAADAAAEAAVREIDVPHYVETGEIRFSGNEYALAEQYANANADYLLARQIAVEIESIAVAEAEDTVQVSALADVSALFPAIAPQVTIRREGTAQVRLTAR